MLLLVWQPGDRFHRPRTVSEHYKVVGPTRSVMNCAIVLLAGVAFVPVFAPLIWTLLVAIQPLRRA